MNDEVVYSLVERIYEAVSAPERWQDFVEELSDALGGAAIFLAPQLPGFRAPIQCYQVHLRPMPAEVLEAVYPGGLPWRELVGRGVPTRFTPLDQLLEVEKLVGSDFAAEWMEPHGLDPTGGLVCSLASRGGESFAAIVIHERRESRALGPADRELCDLLAPHLASAFRLRQRIGGEQHGRAALTEVVNRLPIGLVLLDRELRPVVTNRSADRVLALGDGFSLGPDGLHAANPRDDAVMQGLFAEMVGGTRGPEHGEAVMAVSRPSGKRSFPVLVGCLEDAAAGDVVEDAVVSVIFGVPESGQGITPEVLGRIYDLTPAESELVRLLAEGRCLKEAAELRGVSLNTVRTQLKHVFAKTDTNRQGELIRLVLTGAASFESDSG